MATHVVHPSTTAPELAAHAASYHHFMLGMKWVIITLGSFLVFATLSFGTNAGLLVGIPVGIIVFGIGVYAMGHGMAHSTESDNPTD